MGISPTQLIIILVIVALLFGTKKLRGMGGDLGGAVKGFKNAMKDENKGPEELKTVENLDKSEGAGANATARATYTTESTQRKTEV